MNKILREKRALRHILSVNQRTFLITHLAGNNKNNKDYEAMLSLLVRQAKTAARALSLLKNSQVKDTKKSAILNSGLKRST